MELVSVAALAENRVIGDDDGIPWGHLPEDNRQFRSRVADQSVILGRRTFDSMRGHLPGRAQVVLSRSEREFEVETAHPATGVEDAIDRARSVGGGTVYVLGGATIYQLFQPHLDRMVLSRIPGEYEGDAFYPEWDDTEWDLVSEEPYDGFTLQQWERR